MEINLFNIQKNSASLIPEKTRNAALAVINEREKYLSSEVVRSKLSPTELAIAISGTKQPIKLYAEKDLNDEIFTMAMFVSRDVGIRHWDNEEKMAYESIRFLKVLTAHYSDLSIEEVKGAFELAAVGALDEYLPRDKDGNPDKNHYQTFSMEYYTKILNAYRKKKSGVWSKAKLALPTPASVISEKVREYNAKAIVAEIYDAYIAYQSGVQPNFVISIYITNLIEKGYIKELPKPLKKDYERSYREMLVSNLPRDEKKKLKEAYALPGMPDYFKNEAQRMANNRAIAKLFDAWIERGFDIIEKKEKK